MKAQKVDNVRFIIKQEHSDVYIDVKSKKGELYLSLSDIFFREGDRWYEIPIRKLQSINIVAKDPLEIEFRLPSIKIRVEGEYAERILALRHLLLPYVENQCVDEDPMVSVVKMWNVGINKIDALADILKLTKREIEELLERAKEEGYLDGQGLTDKGKKFIGIVGGD